MNKKYIYTLCAAAFVMTSCDYNEDNFPGFDQNPATDVVYYEGDFTGKYPTEGYFSLVQGDEDAGKATIEKALVSMLSTAYPYCDKGSSAKVKVKVADVLPPQGSEPVAEDEYELTKEDYDAMGTGKNEPGAHDNFAYNIDPNNYLPAFCAAKYADKQVGFVCKITYQYYSNYVTTTQAKFYKKGASEWAEDTGFKADKSYAFTDTDYADIAGTDSKGFVGSDAEVAALISLFLQKKYIAADGMTVALNYKHAGKSIDAIYRYNGKEWGEYNPAKEVVTSVNERITVMKFDGKDWKLSNLISNVEKVTLTAVEYTKLVTWVKENKPEYMSTQNDYSEYYFGAAFGKNNNINNAYSTWFKYYNVDGYLDGLENEEIQAIMDERLANEALAVILLPDLVTNPDPDTSYTVIYQIYQGRGSGDYAMSFYYNADDKTFTWDEMAPVRQ